MALVRCEDHGKPTGRSRKYIRSVQPFGFPDTAAMCGRKGCNNPGLVWLEAHEWRDYTRRKQKIFRVLTSTVQIRVQ